MNLEQGDVVWALDPFKDGGSGRPWLVLNNHSAPFDGQQFICATLTTQTYHEQGLLLTPRDYRDGPLPDEYGASMGALRTPR